MGNSEIAISGETMTSILLFLLYAPVVLISYWKIIPRLSPTARRIASGFLAAQTLVIVVSLEIQPSSNFESWLWDIDREWNIVSILASTQLALVGGVALTTAWLTRARSAWQCLYLLGVGLVFLYLGMDEFFSWKDFMGETWEHLYKSAGAAITAATITLAIRSAKHTRIWRLCLLMGLALAAMGGLVIDTDPVIRGHLKSLYIDGHLGPYFLEEGLEFLGIWLVLAAMLGHFSEVSPAVRVQRFLYVLPALWILLLSQSAAILPIRKFFFFRGASPVSVEFESLHLRGFHINRIEGFHPFLHFSLRQWDSMGLGYSIHLVDKVSGESVASRHEQVDLQHSRWAFGTRAPVYSQRMEIEIPPQPPNRLFYIVLTVWREKDGEYIHQRVLASDRQLLDDTQVILAEVRIPAWAIPAASTATPPDVSLAR